MSFPESKEFYRLVSDDGGTVAILLGNQWMPAVTENRVLIDQITEEAKRAVAARLGVKLRIYRYQLVEVIEP